MVGEGHWDFIAQAGLVWTEINVSFCENINKRKNGKKTHTKNLF